MQATYIQKIIRLNAKQIAIKEGLISMCNADARQLAKDGEKAFAIEAYKEAAKLGRAKAKLVDIQRVLKAELATIHRSARIERKYAALKAAIPGFGLVSDESAPDLTSREMESALDHCIDVFIPKKPDTRAATAA